MLEEDILDFLTEKKTLDEIRSELNINKKKLKRKLKSMLQDEIVESDGDYYWKKSEKSVRIHTSYIPIVLLIAIVILGFYLRIYHIDYPVIGYHNWKDEHYLGEARNFARDGFFKYGFFVPVWDYPGLRYDPSGAHSDTFPLVSILGGAFFMIFGIKLWVARMITILASTISIILMYFIIKRLFNREDIAIVSSFLTSISPLFVFYAHNFQLVNMGLPLMLFSIFFYLKWIDNEKWWYFVLASFCITLSTMTKYSFLVGIIPILFIFPFGRIKSWRKYFKQYLSAFLIFLMFPTWYIYSTQIVAKEFSTHAKVSSYIQPEKILTSHWWKMMESYIRDNYTMLGFYFAILGVILLLVGYICLKKRNAGEKFLLGCFVGIMGFIFIMAGKLEGHSYHQFPVAPFVVMFMSYFIAKISDFTQRLKVEGKGVPFMNLIIIFLLLVVLFPPMRESANRQFDTQFFGLDVAGEYLKEHKSPGEWVMHSSHQAYGLLWHADMKGTRGIPKTVEDIKFAEEKLNASWVFTYNFCYPQGQVCFEVYSKLYEDSWSYIKNQYLLKQIAFVRSSKGNIPVYYLLKKGGTFDENELNEMIMGKPVMHRDYELTFGMVRLNYINIEE